MSKSHNRRAVAQPRTDDTRPCPYCRGLMFFQESTSIDAGWFCTCGYRILLRQESMAELRRVVAERRANAFRRSMAVRARAQRLLKKSERLAAQRRGKK